VPIPALPDGGRAHPLAAADALFRQLHSQIRSEIAGLTNETLHWTPAQGANSIATLVVHVVGSEVETMQAIAGVAVSRDRDAEFVESSLDVAGLCALLDEADALLDQVAIRAPDLGRRTALPTLPADELRPAMTWLIANYGHAREHFGQLLLTKQLAVSAGA
jgi:uncharacterized protein DUF1572